MESDTAVPGYKLGDVVYIRGRVVAFIKDPFDGDRPLIVANPIGKNGKPLAREGEPMMYYIQPPDAVTVATVTQEVKS